MFSYAGVLSADVSHAAGSVSVSDADSLRAKINEAEGDITVSLSSDIILENTSEDSDDTACGLDISGNKTVTILFNGHKITSDTLGTTVNVESGSAVIFGDPGDISNRSETGTAFSAGTPAASLKAASGMELCFYKDTEAKVKTTASDRDAKLVRSVKKAVAPVTYKLKITASEGGKIKDTNGNIIAGAGKTKTAKCSEGATVTYKAVPVKGYKITAIKVNGKDRTVKKKLGQKITIRNISKDTTLEVTFKIRKFHIVATKKTTPKGDGGTITKSCYVKYGGKKTFKIAAKFGYEVKKVYVDGESVKIKPKYTFKNVKKKHTIKVVFKKAKVLKIMLDA